MAETQRRELERAAAGGDRDAERKLARERIRSGEIPAVLSLKVVGPDTCLHCSARNTTFAPNEREALGAVLARFIECVKASLGRKCGLCDNEATTPEGLCAGCQAHLDVEP